MFKKFPLIFALSASFFISCTDDEYNETIATQMESKGIINEISDSDRDVLLKLVNNYRTSGCTCENDYFAPMAPLKWNDVLEQAANNHSDDMNKNNFFSHVSPSGSTLQTRLQNVGYLYMTAGENIARGYNSPEAVVKGWIDSPGHCKNIMNSQFTEMAIAKSGSYWTQVFGTKR